MIDKRRYKRLDIDVNLKINELSKGIINEEESIEGWQIDVFNISKSGMGFTCNYDIPIGTFFDTKVLLWMKDTFEAVIKVVRKNKDGDKYVYGCEFVGLVDNISAKIDVYQILQENNV